MFTRDIIFHHLYRLLAAVSGEALAPQYSEPYHRNMSTHLALKPSSLIRILRLHNVVIFSLDFRFAREMYLPDLPSLLIFTFLIILPTSFSAPATNLTEAELIVDCDTTYPVPGQPTWNHYAPFPSHCRSLANQMALFPDAQTPLPFDERYPASRAAGRPVINFPYFRTYETCVVTFFPPATPGTANPNLARYADFAGMVRFSVKTCFDVLSGKESEGDVVAFGEYTGQDGNAWTAVLTGPLVRPRSTESNVTILDGDSRSSLNGSLIMVAGEEDGTGATGRVDVT